MGKEVKEYVQLILGEGCKKWLVFSEEECGYSFKEAIERSMSVVYVS